MGAFDGFVSQRQIEIADATSGDTLAIDASGRATVNINDATPISVSLDALDGAIELEVKNDAGNPIPVSGTVSVNEPVSIDDNGGSITVDDGGGSITVDGTVATSLGTLTPLGYEQITVLKHDVGDSTLTVPVGATMALIQNYEENGDKMWWRDDGTGPAKDVGMYFPKGATMEYRGDLSAFKITCNSDNRILNVSYYSD